MGRGCEAKFHHHDCPCPSCKYRDCENCPDGIRLTVDHITPRSIRQTWNAPINGDSTTDKSNIQLLNPLCHRSKDWSTPIRAIFARRQQNGALINHELYQQEVLKKDLRDVITGEKITPSPDAKIIFKR